MVNENKPHWGNFEVNIKFLQNKINLLKNKRILEIGCGTGQLVKHLSSKGFDITGIDYSEKMIMKAKKNTKNSQLYVMDGQNLKFSDHSFDIALSFDVLEHIPDVNKHLLEINRILKPNGYYLAGTPNKLYSLPFSVIQNKSLTKHQKYHCSLQTLYSLSRLFNEFNFELEFTKMNTKTDFLLRKTNKVLGPVTNLIKIVNFEKLPLFLQTNFYLVAKKKYELA